MGQHDLPGTHTTAKLAAARGEYESFQIAVRAPAGNDLTNVNVSVSDLQGSGGQAIAKMNVTLYREQYVHVDPSSPNWHGANQPIGPGWYADGLIPFVDPATGAAPRHAGLRAAPAEVEAGANQPFWVDVLVPRDAVPGLYSGDFTVTSDQGAAHGHVELRVWNFTLPVAPALKSAFMFFHTPTQADEEELLRNKVAPLAVNEADEKDLIKRHALSAVNLGLFSGADVSHCAMSPAPPAREIRRSVSRHRPELGLFDYMADEIGTCPSLFPQVKQWARALHRAGVKTMVTMAPVSELMDDGSGSGRSAVDIWVVLPEMYEKAEKEIIRAQAKGDKIWSYNTLVQDPYSPKWEIDFAPINFRIQPGFISQSLNLSGLLYWRVDSWGHDPWNDVNNAGQFSSNNYPGEGMLIYPGAAVGITGVAPSMRLKWIRDGVEDYEYVDLLKKAGYGDWALEVVRGAGRDWSNWTRDPKVLEQARRELGEKLDALSRSRSEPRPRRRPMRHSSN